MLRLLLLALMGVALASRLALGATFSTAGSGEGAGAGVAHDPLAQLRAAMIICHAGHGNEPTPQTPQAPLVSDLLLFDQVDNAHALASDPAVAAPLALRSTTLDLVAAHAADRPPLWRSIPRARGPPATI